mgnify:CR=1 FL=1
MRTGWEGMGLGEWQPPMAIAPLPGPVPVIPDRRAPRSFFKK